MSSALAFYRDAFDLDVFDRLTFDDFTLVFLRGQGSDFELVDRIRRLVPTVRVRPGEERLWAPAPAARLRHIRKF